jgi:hypothetical protein
MTRRNERQVFSDRYFDLQETLDGSSGRLQGELPGLEFRLVSKALTERADMFNDLPGPRIGKSQRMADALVSISQDSLEPVSDGTGSSQRSDPLATVLVDADLAGQTAGEAGAEIEYGPRVGPQTLERILCGGRIQVLGITNGKPVTFSPAIRSISPAIRRFVAWRDSGCTVPAVRAGTASNLTTSNTAQTTVMMTPTTLPLCAGSTTTS